MELAIKRPVRKACWMAIEEDLKPISDEFGFFITASLITSSQFWLQTQPTNLGWLCTLPEHSTLTEEEAMLSSN